MSQKEISNILEVSQTIYGKWESDIFFPTYKNLKKIASFYLVDIECLADNKKTVDCPQEFNFLNKISDQNPSKKIFKILKKIEKRLLLLTRQIEFFKDKR